MRYLISEMAYFDLDTSLQFSTPLHIVNCRSLKFCRTHLLRRLWNLHLKCTLHYLSTWLLLCNHHIFQWFHPPSDCIKVSRTSLSGRMNLLARHYIHTLKYYFRYHYRRFHLLSSRNPWDISGSEYSLAVQWRNLTW